MKEIFYELINEAVNGKVIFGDEEWPVGFNTKIIENGKEKLFLNSDSNMSILYIKHEEVFLKKLEEYINLLLEQGKKTPIGNNEKDKIKWLMMYLFVYATTEDFYNPIEYIEKRIDFIKDHTFDELNDKISIPLNSKIENVNLEIHQEEAPVTMETPKRIVLELRDTKEDVVYPLPKIYYAIREENHKKVCYIYSIINSRKRRDLSEQEVLFNKKINRLLFKINDGVTDTEDYNLEGDENIKDVSMSFVFALNIFVSLLQRKGIEEIKAVPYLPLGYLAREITARKSDRREELRERNKRIQMNQTNKFVRTFRRLSAQNDALKIVSYPYRNDEFLTMILSPRQKELDNMLLEETNKKVVEEIIK